jgi:hypothetical protein
MGRMAVRYGGQHHPLRNFYALDAEAEASMHAPVAEWQPYFRLDPWVRLSPG